MNTYTISIRQFGTNAILLKWPNKVEEAILGDVLGFANYLKENHLDTTKWELVPVYNSLTLICRDTVLDFDRIKQQLLKWYSDKGESILKDRQLWRLPVCYDVEFGIDLNELSQQLGMTVEDIVTAHSKAIYTVYGIGFLPGFMYLGGVPEALEVPRKSVPRAKVLKGSVGLAGKQTGIYPQDSPGGWNLIGRCSVPMFDIKKENPCFVKVGDKVQFYPISMAEFQLHMIESEVGIYKIEKIGLDG
ncbi:MAG TPA: 5-oxoprolinase subunit PxpB [Arenibacter sp.]|nr:5-oxoprolinase subunit PxpB [Arenibacter sp.]